MLQKIMCLYTYPWLKNMVLHGTYSDFHNTSEKNQKLANAVNCYLPVYALGLYKGF